jgi:hypothetical protein
VTEPGWKMRGSGAATEGKVSTKQMLDHFFKRLYRSHGPLRSASGGGDGSRRRE